jgi:hypothetical protein
VAGIAAFADDVRAGRFPADDESYHLASEVARTLGQDDGDNDSLAGLYAAVTGGMPA